MTVIEYEIRFNRLPRDAPMLVAKESDRCRHFEEGLNHEIWSQFMLGDFRNYEDLRAAAIRAERQLQERERYPVVRKSRNAAKGQGGESSGRSGKKQKYDSTVQTPPLCMHCSRRHQEECRKLSSACF